MAQYPFQAVPPSAFSRENEQGAQPPPPPDAYNGIMQFLFLYIFPVLNVGSKNGKLRFIDLPTLSGADEPLKAFVDYQKIRGSSKQICCWLRNSPGNAVTRMRLREFLWSGVLLLVQNAGSLATPIIIEELLDFLETRDPAADKIYGYFLSLAMFAASIAQCLTIHRFWYESSVVGLHSQCALTTDVYVKALQLSARARSNTTTGKLTNHMAIDAARLNDSFVYPSAHWFTWSALITIVVAMYKLGDILGTAGFIGAAALAVLVPLSAVITRSVKRLSAQVQDRRDHRGRLISEAIAGIQTLKAYGWIDWMSGKVATARKEEISYARLKQYIAVVGDFIGSSAPILMTAAMFALYDVYNPHQPLTAAKAFASVSWVATLQFPLRSLPYTITTFVDAHVSLQRLSKYFGYADADVSAMAQWIRVLPAAHIPSEVSAESKSLPPDLEAPILVADSLECRPSVPMKGWLDLSSERNERTSADQTGVFVHKASFGWVGGAARGESVEEIPPSDQRRVTVRDASFSVQPGELLLITGPVGSGKSSLLCGLIGEAECFGGEVMARGRVAFAGQTPWVLNRTLRENVIFCSPYRPLWYMTVMRACGLDVDASKMCDGHDTIIGDAGVTLSGGQKARVALARAIYADSDIVLLDDVLSAVDGMVGAHVWEQCVSQLLLARNKVVILATHAVHFAKRKEVTMVLLLDDTGYTRAIGPYDQVSAASPESFDVTHSYQASTLEAVLRLAPAELSPPVVDPSAEQPAPMTPVAQLDANIERYAMGTVQTRFIWKYIRSFGGNIFLLCLALLYLLSQAAAVLSSYWLTVWVQNANVADPVSSGLTSRPVSFYVHVYIYINVGMAVMALLRMLMLTVGSLRASTSLHNQAFNSVMGTGAGFFAANPSGRIINRFLADISTIDDTVRSSISSLVMLLFQFVAVLVVIGYTTPLMLVGVIILAWFYYQLANRYRISARDLRRMQSVAKSPILSNFAETLRGVPVIRAFGPAAAHHFVRRHISLLREYSRAWLAYWSANEFISTWLELLGALLIMATTFLAVFQHYAGNLSAADVGFMLTYILQIPSIFMWLVRYVSQVETDAVALERVIEYSELPNEETTCILPSEGSAAHSSRLNSGITFQDVWLRYNEASPWILKGLTLSLPPASKCAVVGRTGAGKSSMMQAVLRMYPFARGAVLVGGAAINSLTCQGSRSKCVALLQDGVLFTGTIRDNLLGPYATQVLCREKRTDAELWELLETVGMAQCIRRMPAGLDSNLSEHGCNVSAGERALLCLARALLHQRRSAASPTVLLCDEPTASVDHAADKIVHDTILSSGNVVLCICHRLHHVHRFDYVAVIDDGKCIEFGAPQVLASDASSAFARLAQISNYEES